MNPEVQHISLEQYEFDIPCEACGQPAVVISKGCGDRRYFAVCADHYMGALTRFESQRGKQCKHCDKKWVNFEDHYRIVDI